MKQIREWLEEEAGAYAAGLALYEAYGTSSVVLSTLRYGETAFTRQKLRAELGKLVQGAPDPPVPIVGTSAKRVHVVPPAAPSGPLASPAADVPETLRQQRSSWYAERHRLHATLELLATDAERRVAAERILVISELLTASYQPAAAAPVVAPRPDLAGVSDQGEIRRLLANLRPQVSKLKKNPARALDLQQAQADIKLLESKLLKP